MGVSTAGRGLAVAAAALLLAFIVGATAPAARSDDVANAVNCGSPEESTLAVVDCAGIDPVPDTDPADSEAVLARAAAASVAADALPHQCRYHSQIAFYAATDWIRLVKTFSLDRSPCQDFYVSVPPLVSDKTVMRPSQPAAIRAFGVHFHPVAEIHYATWKTWIAKHVPPIGYYDAGVEAGHRLVAAGYETWALNELPSSVRQGRPGERADAADFIRGLYDGSGGAKGIVFVAGLAQSTTYLDVYRANLTNWLRDSLFWSSISGEVTWWGQELYGDVRDWAVPGASREARTSHLADYLMHPLALLDSLAGDETTAAARAFLEATYVPVTNDAWPWPSAFGFTDIPVGLMESFLSEQVFAVRHFAGANPQGAPSGLFASAWALPKTLPPAAESQLLLDRTASALHYTYEQGGSTQEGACGPPGDQVWCQGELDGAAFVDSWSSFAP